MNLPPFYVGQRVIAVDAVIGAGFKNGQTYTVAAIEYRLGNPYHPVGRITYYWYVGIVGWENGGAYYRPGIFAALEEETEWLAMTFAKLVEIEREQILLNN